MTAIKRCVQAFFNEEGSLYCLNCDKNHALNYREFHRDLEIFSKFLCCKCFQYVGVSIVKSEDCQYCLKENEMVSYYYLSIYFYSRLFNLFVLFIHLFIFLNLEWGKLESNVET